MAFLSKKSRDENPALENSLLENFGGIFRWMAVPVAGVALWSLVGMAGAYSAATSVISNSTFLPLPATAAASDRDARIAAFIVQQGKSDRLGLADAAGVPTIALPGSTEKRFELVVASAQLTPGKLAALFSQDRQAASAQPARERFHVAAAVGAHGPLSARFGPVVAETDRSSRLALALAGAGEIEVAYAYTPDTASDAFSGLILAPEQPAALAALEDDAPTFDAMPETVPVPLKRPKFSRGETAKPEIRETKPQAASPQIAAVAKPGIAPAQKSFNKRGDQQAATMLAYAKPDLPATGGLGGAFKNLFATPNKPSAGTAVYDISAAKVYMPDGSVLEAHSGIGNMADNPRYVSQKMRGPTPPNTYKLSMRESRFYGVEAIRMTPVGSQKMHGRTGILAHSYLLRGGRAESHGCVAFRDYQRFLKAFKQGKIQHLVVVPGGGAGAAKKMVAQNGSRV